MKRRPRSTNDADRAQLEREAEAELQREIGKPAVGRAGGGGARRRTSGASADRPRAWGSSPSGPAPTEPDAEPAWQPSHGGGAASPVGRRPQAPAWEEQEDVADDEDVEDEWADDEGEWEDDEEEEYVPGQPIGLLGVPLDYDATGIALEQLAQRSNVQRPASMVVGVDASEAAQIRDRAMAQFLERQKARSREDTERAAARAAVTQTTDPPAKRAPFPQLSPGLSAKSLVMQPVSAPPLNLPGATSVSPELVEARAKAERTATREAAEAEQASRPKRTRSAPAAGASAKPVKKSAAKATAKATKTSATKATTKASGTKAARSAKAAKAAKAAEPAAPKATKATKATKPAAAKAAEPAAPKATKAPVTKTPATATKAGTTKAGTKKVGTAKKAGAATPGRKVARAESPVPAPTAGSDEPAAKKAVTKKAVTKTAVAKRAPATEPAEASAPTPTGRAARAAGNRPVIRRPGRARG